MPLDSRSGSERITPRTCEHRRRRAGPRRQAERPSRSRSSGAASAPKRAVRAASRAWASVEPSSSVERAAMRIGGIDRLQLDQRLVLRRRRAAAIARIDAITPTSPARPEELQLLRRSPGAGAARRRRRRRGWCGPAIRMPSVKRARDGIDAGDGGDAERDAGDEDIEAGKPAAQFAEREPERERQGRAAHRPRGRLSQRRRAGLDLAAGDPDDAVAARRELDVVRDEDERRARARRRLRRAGRRSRRRSRRRDCRSARRR